MALGFEGAESTDGRTRDKRRLISIVIPAFNEDECVDELARRLQIVCAGQAHGYDFEFIVIENGSKDLTFIKLLTIRENDSRFKIIRFSRNFGIEAALTAGLRHARGDAAVIMCADLQDPPELIPDFISAWEEGYENVYGVIERRNDEGFVRRLFTRAFYWIVNRANEHPVPENVSDFRLIDRKLYEVVARLPERNRMLRTIWGWLGYRSIGVHHVRPPRYGGKSTYNLVRNVLFGIRGIATSTVTPLRLIPSAGLALAGLTFTLFVGFVVRWLISGVPFDGFGTIVTLLLLMFSVLFLLLGILSEYIGMIFEEVRARPMYIIDDRIGIAAPSVPESSNVVLTR